MSKVNPQALIGELIREVGPSVIIELIKAGIAQASPSTRVSDQTRLRVKDIIGTSLQDLRDANTKAHRELDE